MREISSKTYKLARCVFMLYSKEAEVSLGVGVFGKKT